jgi:multidrug efflux pump subunit AcrA (membrane-fusion protein)
MVQVRKIETGPSTGDQTIITSGLAEGERIVIDG